MAVTSYNTYMPEQQGSSFIPKAGAAPVRRTGVTRRIYLLSYLSYIIFFSVLFATVGIFLYGIYVDRSLASVQDELAKEQARFSSEEVDSVHHLSSRLETAERILNSTAAPSNIFTAIEDIVASNIVFSGMTYKHLPNDRFSIALIGLADDFNEVIHQNKLMQGNSLFEGIEVSEFDYSVTGDEAASTVAGQAVLTFIFSDTRDISLIPYTASASNQGSVEILSEEDSDSESGSVEVISARPEAGTSTDDGTDTAEVVDSNDSSDEVVNENSLEE